MQCPVCKNVNLVMSERQGIEIDYCPQCRGVWLDRGELDKMIDRSATTNTSASTSQPVRPQNMPEPNRTQDHMLHHGSNFKKKKRGGFLDDLFDFD
jgi:Zn-finger nucleic acid-binding protein